MRRTSSRIAASLFLAMLMSSAVPARAAAQRGFALGARAGRVVAASATTGPRSDLQLSASYAPTNVLRWYAAFGASELGTASVNHDMAMYTSAWSVGAELALQDPTTRPWAPWVRAGLGMYSAYQPDWRQYATGRSPGLDVGAGIIIVTDRRFSFTPAVRVVSFGPMSGFGNATQRYDIGRVTYLAFDVGATYHFGLGPLDRR